VRLAEASVLLQISSVQLRQTRKDVADLLRANKQENARIRVEAVIREINLLQVGVTFAVPPLDILPLGWFAEWLYLCLATLVSLPHRTRILEVTRQVKPGQP